ncbi:nucleoside-diphosphate-sugar epimerase [Azomonas macrocytogenes]|uniref:Nucleoside-diphosphate-sugar epimerase n=1 Tax=Azomonas macrocytogenes TaxID=69962 RepID=A0A839T338_AZOMA|nr:nucleoside-diphosphate-sugar epimerase [Azomonas macrocytogenes]
MRRFVANLPGTIRPLPGDLFDSRCPPGWPTAALDYLVYCAAATGHDESAYRATYVDGLNHVLSWLALHGQRPRRLLFVSSTGVYGQCDGEWVDEDSPTLPSGFSGRLLLEAERLLLDSGHPASVIRLAGIYGPGRQWLLSQVRQGYRVAEEPALYGNRIHADDAAGLLAFLLAADARGETLADCYLGVDDEPAPLHEVVGWLRQRLGVTLQVEENIVRRSASKRCSNARARALGWSPLYPSYREGYEALIAATG